MPNDAQSNTSTPHAGARVIEAANDVRSYGTSQRSICASSNSDGHFNESMSSTRAISVCPSVWQPGSEGAGRVVVLAAPLRFAYRGSVVGELPPARYRIKARIGTGGMGEVYRAVDKTTGEVVAIKVLKQEARTIDRTRFKREVRILAELRHPGVVRYIDHGQTKDGRLFLVMEWLNGEDLAHRLARRPVGMADAVELVRRASQALAAVHARGIVHRDLKPSNIFIEVHDNVKSVKLIDFGMVKVSDPDDHTTQRGSFLGTPWFMAPEQARGAEVDARADVYALGAVLFRLVTGRNAFESRHLIAYLGRLVLEEAPRASSFRQDVPQELDDLLASCLRRSPIERPQDAGDLARRLARLPSLSNDPPPQGRSRVSKMPTPPPMPGPARSSSFAELLARMPEGVAREKRVVAVLLASVPQDGLPPDAAGAMTALLGDKARFELLGQGDLVVALGLDRTVGDEVVRAARAALYLQRIAPGAKIAVATGRAVAGPRGLAGEALDLAAAHLERIEGAGIRVDRGAQALLDGRFVTREDETGAALIKEQVSDAEVRPLRGKDVPMIGRTRELEMMLGLFDEVMSDGLPRICLVVGQGGLGKSRLRKEFLRRLLTDLPAVEVLLARGDPMLSRGGVSDIGRALRVRMGIRDGEAQAAQAIKLVRYVAQTEGFPEASVDFLGEFVGVSSSEDSYILRSARDAPQLMAARMFYAVECLVRHDAESVPQILVLEDFEHLDDLSVALTEWLLQCKDMRLAVYAFSRPSCEVRFPQVFQDKRVTRLRLGPLPRAACEQIVDIALPDATPNQRRQLVDRSQGNPLFLEELIRVFDPQRVELPVSVQAVLQSRLDAAPEEQRKVVRAASVFGEVFWSEGVSVLLGRGCASDLEALEQAEVVVRRETSSIEGQHEWAFCHGLVRETAYASLLDDERAALHRKAAQWLLTAEQPDLGAVAMHAEAGQDRGEAVALYAKAAARAYARGQLATALDFAMRGAAGADDATSRARCLLQQAQILSWMGRYEEQRAAAKAAGSLGQPGSDLWGEARRLEAAAQREEGRSSEADLLLASTLQQPQASLLSPATRSRILAEWARTLVDLGRAREGFEVASQAVHAAQAAGDAGINAMVRALDARSMAVGFLGDFSAAVEAARETTSKADEIGETFLATRARVNLGFALARVGFLEEGEAELQHALADARILRMRAGEGFALHNLGRISARRGDLDRAIDLECQAAEIAEETRHHRLALLSRVYEAIYLAMRRTPEDLGRAVLLVELARADAPMHPFAEAEATLASAWVERVQGNVQEALARCEETINSLGILGTMEEGEERLRLMQVELLIELGREDDADLAIRDAYDCVMGRCRRMSNKAHRDAYLSRLEECRKIVDLASERLSLTRPMILPEEVRSRGAPET